VDKAQSAPNLEILEAKPLRLICRLPGSEVQENGAA
jgi:hypothetical protein